MSEESKTNEVLPMQDFPKRKAGEMWSFAVYSAGIHPIVDLIKAYVLFFYTELLGLPFFYYIIGLVVFTIWDAINDPLMGYLSDNPTRFTPKFGKRFPWLIIGIVAFTLFGVLMFTSPTTTQVPDWVVFIYFLVIYSLFDTAYSMWQMNDGALFPDKYRNTKQRAMYSGIRQAMFFIMGLVESLLVALFLDYNVRSSFIILGIIGSVIGIVFLLIGIPGMREDKEMRERAVAYYASRTEKPGMKDFFKDLKMAFKQKNFWIYILMVIFIFAGMSISGTPMQYFMNYVINEGPDVSVIMNLPAMILSIIAIPLWVIIMRKMDQKKGFIILLALDSVIFIINWFAGTNLIVLTISFALHSLMIGGVGVFITPLAADMYDDAAVLHKKRMEGILNGVYAFSVRAAIIIQAGVIALLYAMFKIESSPFSYTAEIGIRITISWAGLVFYLIGLLIFIFGWSLTDEKKAENKRKLQEMGL